MQLSSIIRIFDKLVLLINRNYNFDFLRVHVYVYKCICECAFDSSANKDNRSNAFMNVIKI